MSQTTTKENPLGDIYEEAAEYIEQNGWVKRKAVGPDGAVCASRALMEVCRPYGLGVADFTEAFVKCYGISLISFNDRGSMTKARLLAKLRDAAKNCRL